ncbi:MAG: DNA polymerase III, subunit gamma and tau [Gammaproteobacteria bacterium RIFCSPHIGHO2_12_FULL_45_9]|nr:MAG: DNA polymerase III, subunit gamma and tau [Gammaproteobacteria bacterium RIFCSPHIGHO2_12_FULL_45_9]
MTRVLARLYRPQRFDAVIGQTAIIRALQNALTQNKLHHAYLFTGTRGVGKTTLARLLALCLNCETGPTPNPCGTCTACREIQAGIFPDLIEIDAASRTKVEDTRDLLDNVAYAPLKGRFKVYLIDEVHMLSQHSFNALLKTLEEPPAHVKFLLATTDPHKLPATILSRCIQFHLKAMTEAQIVSQLTHILTEEQATSEPAALQMIATHAQGSMRDALSLLDQALMLGNGTVDITTVQAMLGLPPIESALALLEAIVANQAETLFAEITRFKQAGLEPSAILSTLLTTLHRLSMRQQLPTYPIPEYEARHETLVSALSPEMIQLLYQITLHGQRDLPYAPNPYLGLEMTCLRLLAFQPMATETTLTQATPPIASSQPVTSSQPVATPTPVASSQTTFSESMPWEQMVPHLKLTGMARSLADHCSLQSRTQTEWQFVLKESHKALLQPRSIERLTEAIHSLINSAIRVKVTLGTGEATPADKQANERHTQLTTLHTQLSQNPGVQHIVNTLGATLSPDNLTLNPQ